MRKLLDVSAHMCRAYQRRISLKAAVVCTILTDILAVVAIVKDGLRCRRSENAVNEVLVGTLSRRVVEAEIEESQEPMLRDEERELEGGRVNQLPSYTSVLPEIASQFDFFLARALIRQCTQSLAPSWWRPLVALLTFRFGPFDKCIRARDGGWSGTTM